MSHAHGDGTRGAPADSAGRPWAGRAFAPAPASADDGSAPPTLVAALDAFHGGSGSAEAVIDALRRSRLLVPLVAHLGESGEGAHGLAADKSADLSIVTVAGPDGRAALPVFGSVASMSRWRADARPVPTDAVRVALAAASEGTELVVLDPGSPTEFALRRPAVWAIAQGLAWRPSWQDPEVGAALHRSVAEEPDVLALDAAAGDPGARLAGPELLVRLRLRPGLDEQAVTTLVGRLGERWTADEIVRDRVDSLGIRISAG